MAGTRASLAGTLALLGALGGAACTPAPASDAGSADAPLTDAQDASATDALLEASSAESGPGTDALLPDGACAPPRVLCAGRCVDTQAEHDHCGACGHACAAAEACLAGACRATSNRWDEFSWDLGSWE